MLTKIPDYIISGRGYPEWDSVSQQLKISKTNASLWRNSTLWSSKSINLVKLLPLRESLTHFYIGKLSKQKDSIHKTQLYYKSNNIQEVKHVKEWTNGVENLRISQLQCPVDNRRFQTTSADNDLDQF